MIENISQPVAVAASVERQGPWSNHADQDPWRLCRNQIYPLGGSNRETEEVIAHFWVKTLNMGKPQALSYMGARKLWDKS